MARSPEVKPGMNACCRADKSQNDHAENQWKKSDRESLGRNSAQNANDVSATETDPRFPQDQQRERGGRGGEIAGMQAYFGRGGYGHDFVVADARDTSAGWNSRLCAADTHRGVYPAPHPALAGNTVAWEFSGPRRGVCLDGGENVKGASRDRPRGRGAAPKEFTSCLCEEAANVFADGGSCFFRFGIFLVFSAILALAKRSHLPHAAPVTLDGCSGSVRRRCHLFRTWGFLSHVGSPHLAHAAAPTRDAPPEPLPPSCLCHLPRLVTGGAFQRVSSEALPLLVVNRYRLRKHRG